MATTMRVSPTEPSTDERTIINVRCSGDIIEAGLGFRFEGLVTEVSRLDDGVGDSSIVGPVELVTKLC